MLEQVFLFDQIGFFGIQNSFGLPQNTLVLQQKQKKSRSECKLFADSRKSTLQMYMVHLWSVYGPTVVILT